MVVSILHRATGVALSFAGLGILAWWLFALSSGPDAFATFTKAATSPLGLVVLIGITWSFFQHLLSGIRHLVMDTGAAFELGRVERAAPLRKVEPGRPDEQPARHRPAIVAPSGR